MSKGSKLLFALVVTITMNSAQRPEVSVETELSAVQKSFDDAIASNDAAAIDRFLTADWVVIDPDGSVIERSRFLEVIRSGALKHDWMESKDLRIRVHGATAIVTALASTKGVFKGQVFATEERATDVYVQRDGRWECVITQLTRYAKKRGAAES